MRRLAYAVLAVAVPLALAAPAVAKEATKARVCGKSDCVTTKDRGVLALFMEGGPPSEPPSAGAAWYRVHMTIDTGDGHRETFPMIVSPRLRLGGSPDAGSYNWFSLSNEAAKGYARIAAINALAAARSVLGSLDRVTRVVKVVGFVASDPSFVGQPGVINGASELLGDVFGPEIGAHARSAVGVAVLPLDSPVEVESAFTASGATIAP